MARRTQEEIITEGQRPHSTNPNAIRRRIHRGQASAHQAARELIASPETNYKPLDEWDDDELAHGRPRNAEGKFGKGRPPKWLSPLIAAEARRRFLDASWRRMAVDSRAAFDCMEKLMKNEQEDEWGKPVVPPALKFQIAKFFLEMTMGTPNKQIQLNVQQDETRTALARALVMPDGSAAHPVIEGEAYEEVTDDER